MAQIPTETIVTETPEELASRLWMENFNESNNRWAARRAAQGLDSSVSYND